MKDYKTGKVSVRARSSHPWLYGSLATCIVCALIWLFMAWTANNQINHAEQSNTPPISEQIVFSPEDEVTQDNREFVNDEEIADSEPILNADLIVNSQSEILTDGIDDIDTSSIDITEQKIKIPWQTITVKSGDSLALIFSRLGLTPGELYNVMSLGKEVNQLKNLLPGQRIKFHIDGDDLAGLEYEIDLTQTLKISKQENNFISELVHEELDTIVKDASAVIKDSLFLSGKRVGLSDNLIMQLVSIYGWDIDFALDIREGDSFTVIYQEQYKNGKKVAEGPIVAAEFINRETPLRAIRYTHPDGRTDYYADNGDAMRKAFLRTPVNFTRISSRFNLKRKHPILNKIRAHKGVDYAAPTGTPIKATGDGTVILAGRKGGYGRTVILKHGGKYSTVYAHLHRYAKGVRKGKRVKQGQIIGYVGKSGLATGPHLHYEFRVHGVHRNPLTVKLPKVESIHQDALVKFKK
ncbi:MAG: peptidoglycan DD-metalloendopeptidase family protein, partial [Proteobacteria bacterium]|nr:peptidoglycan DD-metalloendopeptidase family protein [Pseudomonadota bacterium]